MVSWQYSIITKKYIDQVVCNKNTYLTNVLNIPTRIWSLIPLVAELAARRWGEYHTESRERISPVAVCFEALAWVSKSTYEM